MMKSMFPPPKMNLTKVFSQIKLMQKDNLNQISIDAKQQKGEQEVKGLKFIAKKLKVLLEKNRKIQYNDASRILIHNFATAQKDERNIKRRVYDAINVLVAAEVVTKQGNKIQLTTNRRHNYLKTGQQVSLKEKNQITQRIRRKQEKVQFLKVKREIVRKLTQHKKSKKQQKIDNPYITIMEGEIQNVVFSKQRKQLVISFEGINKFKQCPVPLFQFLGIQQ